MSLSRTVLVQVVAFAASCGVASAAAASLCTLDRATGMTIDPQPLLAGANGVRWNAAIDRLVFTRRTSDGYDRLFISRPNGSDAAALLAPSASPGRGHQGAAYWHPSGRYLAFVAQKADWAGRRLFGVPDYEALPGFGRHDDLWLAAADGRRVWKLTDSPNTRDEGVLAPAFAPTGRRLAWSARLPGGTYALTVADFSDKPQPHIDEVRTYRPGGPAYYETGSFSTDGTRLFYASDQDTHSFWRSQIYSLDLGTGRSTRLTRGNDYNEHPTVVPTPSGDWVVYMSTEGVERRAWHVFLGTDWYAMRADGSGAKRLTTMNVNRPDPENSGAMQVAGTVAISPSGTFMIGDVQDSLTRQTGFARVVRFTCR